MTLRNFLTALFLLPWLVTCAGAQGTLAERLDDVRLETSIRLALAENAEARNLNIGAAATEGAVVLSGLVPTLSSRDRVVDLVSSLRGVRIVRSLLRLGGHPGEPLPDPISAGQPNNVSESDIQDGSSARDEVNRQNDTPAFHTVQRGDTLYSIAQRYGTTVSVISQLSNLSSTTVRIGQRLRVR